MVTSSRPTLFSHSSVLLINTVYAEALVSPTLAAAPTAVSSLAPLPLPLLPIMSLPLKLPPPFPSNDNHTDKTDFSYHHHHHHHHHRGYCPSYTCRAVHQIEFKLYTYEDSTRNLWVQEQPRNNPAAASSSPRAAQEQPRSSPEQPRSNPGAAQEQPRSSPGATAQEQPKKVINT